MTPQEIGAWLQARAEVLVQLTEPLVGNAGWERAAPRAQERVLRERLERANESATRRLKAEIGATEIRRGQAEAERARTAS